MALKRVLGIDPGLDGGLALYTFDYATGSEKLEIQVMPTMPSGDSKKELDIDAIKQWLHVYVPGTSIGKAIDLAVIEKVGAMPGQGVTSMFTFGTGYGELRGALKWARVSTIRVPPQRWKKQILSGTQKDKGAAINFVRNRFPCLDLRKSVRSKKEHDGMADAVCLALYGRYHLRGALDE